MNNLRLLAALIGSWGIMSCCESLQGISDSNTNEYSLNYFDECQLKGEVSLNDSFIPYEAKGVDVFSEPVFFYDLWSILPEVYANGEKKCPHMIKVDDYPLGYLWKDLTGASIKLVYRNVYLDSVVMNVQREGTQQVTPDRDDLNDLLNYRFVQNFSALDFEQGFMLYRMSFDCFGMNRGSLVEVKKSEQNLNYDVVRHVGLEVDTSFSISQDYYSKFLDELGAEMVFLENSDRNCSSFSHYFLKAGSDIFKYTDATCRILRDRNTLSLLYGE